MAVDIVKLGLQASFCSGAVIDKTKRKCKFLESHQQSITSIDQPSPRLRRFHRSQDACHVTGSLQPVLNGIDHDGRVLVACSNHGPAQSWCHSSKQRLSGFAKGV